jgi:alkylated DNA repair dioxygenase AlkB
VAADGAAAPPAPAGEKQLPPRARRLAAKRSTRQAERAAQSAAPPPLQRHHALRQHAPAPAPGAVPAQDPLPEVATSALLASALAAAHAALKLPSPVATADGDAAAPTLTLDDVAAALLARAPRLPLQALADASWALEAVSHPSADAFRAAMGAPFSLHPGALAPLRLGLAALQAEVALKRDEVKTASGEVMPETRLTAWQSDFGDSFRYSGKAMAAPPGGLTPRVAAARDALEAKFGVRYDSCLVNYYPDGSSGMRFHSDPQGAEWAPQTAVVSVGAPRRFVFRAVGDPATRCATTVRSGDVVIMGPGCQERFQHALLPEASADDAAPRISLVFKKRAAKRNE